MAKADKFGFTSSYGIVKANGHLPGQIYGVLGVKIAVPAQLDPAEEEYTFGFGEIVAVVKDSKGAYLIRPIKTTDTSLPNMLAVIERNVVGGTDVGEGKIDSAKHNVAYSIWLLADIQYGSIVVPFKDTASAVTGGQAYLGNGLGGTTAGTVYASAGTGKVAITGWKFVDEEFAPTRSDALAVAIAQR